MIGIEAAAFGRLWLALLLAGAVVASGCATQKALSREEIDSRAQEYFSRGMEQFQRGELRPALESFRTAKAYDLNGSNPTIAEMIDKAETKLRVPSSSGSTAAASAPQTGPPPRAADPVPPRTPLPAPPAPSPPIANAPPPAAAAGPRLDAPFKTYRSAVYPYSIEIPESWALGPTQPDVGGVPVEVLAAPDAGPVPTDVGLLALPLASDVDGRAFYEGMRKGLKVAGIDPVEIGKRPIDGAEARLLRANVTDHQGKHVSTMVIFEAERVGWLIMFTTAPEHSERLQPLFHRMLDSFRIGKQSRVI